jgi:hypothetical protein
MEMNTQKDIYLFLHERMDHKERAMNALISAGNSHWEFF